MALTKFFKLLVVILLLLFYVICDDVGPMFKPTKGEVWPKPHHQVTKNIYYVLELGNGTFRITKPHFTCDILEEGIKRLLHQNVASRQNFVWKKLSRPKYYYYNKYFKGYFGAKTEFRIELTRKCEDYPHLDMDETYKLTVGAGGRIVLSSTSIWGILRGMQTFDHLLYYSDDYTEIRINATSITDHPAYPHRGLLIDTARHYLQPKTIHLLIDAMEVNKMNVIHWHVVDDESFPFQSERLPKLSKKGAFHPSMVYTQKVIREIIEHARLAGIRVIPEFDAPGHVRSWGSAYPNILTECHGENHEVVALGSLYPINNASRMILQKLYEEVTELFPDEYIHLGGDEVDEKCWISNLNIYRFLRQNRLKSSNVLRVLGTDFVDAVKVMVPPKSKFIFWQDMFDAEVPLPAKTVIQVWKTGPIKEMTEVLKSGYRVLFSSSWYLDNVSATWETFYSIDPRHMVFNESRANNVLNLQEIVGGEACMWGEMVDDTNIFSRTWPRASAVAERLWTGADYKSSLKINATKDTRRRMEEHTCRMRLHGMPAEPPNGPGFCIASV